jgi:hypothetical protein
LSNQIVDSAKVLALDAYKTRVLLLTDENKQTALPYCYEPNYANTVVLASLNSLNKGRYVSVFLVYLVREKEYAIELQWSIWWTDTCKQYSFLQFLESSSIHDKSSQQLEATKKRKKKFF